MNKNILNLNEEKYRGNMHKNASYEMFVSEITAQQFLFVYLYLVWFIICINPVYQMHQLLYI